MVAWIVHAVGAVLATTIRCLALKDLAHILSLFGVFQTCSNMLVTFIGPYKTIRTD